MDLISDTSRVTTIRVATQAPPGSDWLESMKRVAVRIAERTSKRVNLRFYPAGICGDDHEVAQQIERGALEGGILGGYALARYLPDIRLLGLPFLVSSAEEGDHLRSWWIASHRDELSREGLECLASLNLGLTRILTTDPMPDLESMRRSRFWLLPDDRLSEILLCKAGMTPVIAPVNEVSAGLRSRHLSAVVTSASIAHTFEWDGMLRYAIDMPVQCQCIFFVLSTAVMQSLNWSDREVVRDEIDRSVRWLESYQRGEEYWAREILAFRECHWVQPRESDVMCWREYADNTLAAAVEAGQVSAIGVEGARAAIREYRQRGETV